MPRSALPAPALEHPVELVDDLADLLERGLSERLPAEGLANLRPPHVHHHGVAPAEQRPRRGDGTRGGLRGVEGDEHRAVRVGRVLGDDQHRHAGVVNEPRRHGTQERPRNSAMTVRAACDEVGVDAVSCAYECAPRAATRSDGLGARTETGVSGHLMQSGRVASEAPWGAAVGCAQVLAAIAVSGGRRAMIGG